MSRPRAGCARVLSTGGGRGRRRAPAVGAGWAGAPPCGWDTAGGPAPVTGSGVVLSDRATLRLEHGGALDAEIAPPSLYEFLRADWPEVRGAASARAHAAAAGLAWAEGDVRRALERSANLDAIQL